MEGCCYDASTSDAMNPAAQLAAIVAGRANGEPGWVLSVCRAVRVLSHIRGREDGQVCGAPVLDRPGRAHRRDGDHRVGRPRPLRLGAVGRAPRDVLLDTG